jgi:glucosamine--fructose-6-phosphate aminotransferase (isomerizing)
MKHSKHIFLLGKGLGEVIAKEGALKIKELTYTHCQCLPLTAVSNHFYNYVHKHPKTPTIFVILEDEYKEVTLESIKRLTEKVDVLPIIITDIRDKPTRDYLDKIAEKRVF